MRDLALWSTDHRHLYGTIVDTLIQSSQANTLYTVRVSFGKINVVLPYKCYPEEQWISPWINDQMSSKLEE